MRKCIKCGKAGYIDPFCVHCGGEIVGNIYACQNVDCKNKGKPIALGCDYCPKCGEMIPKFQPTNR